MKRLFPLFLLVLLYQDLHSQGNKVNGTFGSPLDIRLVLAGNFAEIRGDHFHSGIDIKTRGTIGHKVRAAAGGYISRISISPSGFGNCIYLAHANGTTTVYGHLNRFRKDVADWVRDQQYKKQTHAVNLYPGKDQWKVRKGDLIAWSGNSGYSAGPHLHFEIRNSANQHPENALRFGLNIADTIAPLVFSLWVYDFEQDHDFTYLAHRERFDVSGKDGKFEIDGGREVSVGDLYGLGIEAYDYLNGAWNRCGLYTIELQIDGQVRFSMKMDEFGFGESRYINSFVDYGYKREHHVNIQKLFIDPGNKLSMYDRSAGNGMVSAVDSLRHEVSIIVRDAYLNESVLEFTVRHRPLPPVEPPPRDRIFHWDSPNEFSAEGIRINLPADILYRDLAFKYSLSDGHGKYLSDIHSVADPAVPVHSPYDLALEAHPMHDTLRDKAVIVSLDDDGIPAYAGGEWEGNWLVCSPNSFGRFAVSLDTTGPSIDQEDPDPQNDLSDRDAIRFRIADDLSGIRSYEGYIDGNWALFEYNARDEEVFYLFDGKRIKKDSRHLLELYVIDNRDNLSYFTTEFLW